MKDIKMVSLVNVSKVKNKPILIDADEVRAVIAYKKENALSIHMGGMEPVIIEGDRLDIDFVLERINHAGDGLFTLSDGVKDESTVVQSVAPKYINLMSTTEPSEGIDCIGIVVAVDGYGRLDIYDLEESRFPELLDKVSSTRPELKRFTPDVAYSRWAKPKELHIDVSKIEEMTTCNGLRVGLKGAGEIDISVKSPSYDEIKETLLKNEPNKYPEEQDLINEARNIRNIIENKNTTEFAQKLVENQKDISEVNNGEYSIFFKEENIHDVCKYSGDSEHQLVVNVKRSEKKPYPMHLAISFNSKSALDNASKDLKHHRPIGFQPQIGHKPPKVHKL